MAHFEVGDDTVGVMKIEELQELQLDDVSLGSQPPLDDSHKPVASSWRRQQSTAQPSALGPRRESPTSQPTAIPRNNSWQAFKIEKQTNSLPAKTHIATHHRSADFESHVADKEKGQIKASGTVLSTTQANVSVFEPIYTDAFSNTLPDDFLRLVPDHDSEMKAYSVSNDSQAEQTRRLASNLQPDDGKHKVLNVEIIDGQMAKRRSFSPLSLYCKVKVSSCVLTTNTHESCGVSPYWNQNFSFILGSARPATLLLEVYDTGFFNDVLLANATVPLGEVYYGGEESRQVHVLDKDGRSQGTVRLVLQIQNSAASHLQQQPLPPSASWGSTSAVQAGDEERATGASEPAAAASQDADLENLQAIFPQFDKEILSAVYMANERNLDASVTALLAML